MFIPASRLASPTQRQDHAGENGTTSSTSTSRADAEAGNMGSSSAGANGTQNPNAPSRAEMHYHMYVESEGQMSTIFQAMTKDPVKICCGLVLVFVASLAASLTIIGLHFEEIREHPLSALSIGMLLLLQTQVALRWFTLVRIRKYNYAPSTVVLKTLGFIRNLSPWVWVLSAMIVHNDGAIGTLFWWLFWIHLVVLDYFFTIVIFIFVALSIIVLPFWLPYTWMKPKGVPKRTINKLPVEKFDPASFAEKGYSLECSICITEFEPDEELRRLPCDHFFHKDCVDTWLNQNATCPMCRNDISNTVESDRSKATTSEADSQIERRNADGSMNRSVRIDHTGPITAQASSTTTFAERLANQSFRFNVNERDLPNTRENNNNNSSSSSGSGNNINFTANNNSSSNNNNPSNENDNGDDSSDDDGRYERVQVV
ncbi:E3 ubiquitin-protein ligase ATL42 [Hondaea fermentalgiana]|uniref:E3 ubiquitin-protein ligase ATL42 n=1 Tax=Hondaea fermentalgiana TaxID=2315210 RepID=A0A2R5GD72_9STRA|nr:E3 ubiquitin-protein ligase ATL42 [Hondaea fermentalgiana]|eukprot:GBG26111.1 E3 ubiquitin-protein ligase ATL42 [Hondaea fermentalgiana]